MSRNWLPSSNESYSPPDLAVSGGCDDPPGKYAARPAPVDGGPFEGRSRIVQLGQDGAPPARARVHGGWIYTYVGTDTTSKT
ncbi:hypothetical protein [Streptomyces sp. NPDC048473]|uniref:hypothetical protein n=1 Tax=unclassified Streptomyces TaxID=2593676 RepID=UPI00371B80C5